MERYRTTTICVDPEVEELRLFNSKVEDNRKQGRIIAEYVNALLRRQKEADLAAAEKRHQRRMVRKYRTQMNKLLNRIILCLLCFLGVYLLWILNLLGAEVVYGAALACTYNIVFTLGRAWDKSAPKGGDNT